MLILGIANTSLTSSLVTAVLTQTTEFYMTPLFLFRMAVLFFVSLISNATPFFGASYTLIATTDLIAFGFTVEGFLVVTVVTALGAAVGKLIIYWGTLGFGKQLRNNKNVQLLGVWLQRRSFLVVVFVTAVIPVLPLDDYLYIGAGATKSRLLPMFSVTILAKIVKSLVEIWLEFLGILQIVNRFPRSLGITPLEFSILLSIFFVLLGIFLFKYDWEKLITRFTRRPGKGKR